MDHCLLFTFVSGIFCLTAHENFVCCLNPDILWAALILHYPDVLCLVFRLKSTMTYTVCTAQCKQYSLGLRKITTFRHNLFNKSWIPFILRVSCNSTCSRGQRVNNHCFRCNIDICFVTHCSIFNLYFSSSSFQQTISKILSFLILDTSSYSPIVHFEVYFLVLPSLFVCILICYQKKKKRKHMQLCINFCNASPAANRFGLQGYF